MKMFKAGINLIIVGAGGHAAELLSYLQDLEDTENPVCLLGSIDEGKPKGHWEESRILGNFDVLAPFIAERNNDTHYITAVGNNRVRQALVAKVGAATKGRTMLAWSLIHPMAAVGRRVEIGEGTLLAPGAIVTTRSRLGRHCILNVKASVSHDCLIGDFVNLNPGATVCGNVQIGEGAFIGTGATVINGVSIGAWSIIGAGAVVIRDIPDHVTAVGVPARVIKKNKPNT